MDPKNNKEGTSKEKMSMSLKIAKSLFASFALFVVCWVPFGLVVSTGFEDKYPIAVHATVTFLAHVNSTMNCVFYMFLNPAFLAGFKKLNKTNIVEITNSVKLNFTMNIKQLIGDTNKEIHRRINDDFEI